jgi:hypothetical protein
LFPLPFTTQPELILTKTFYQMPMVFAVWKKTSRESERTLKR